jgi:hypothetical protein
MMIARTPAYSYSAMRLIAMFTVFEHSNGDCRRTPIDRAGSGGLRDRDGWKPNSFRDGHGTRCRFAALQMFTPLKSSMKGKLRARDILGSPLPSTPDSRGGTGQTQQDREQKS